MQVDLGSVLVEVGDYSFPVVSRGETLSDRIAILTPLGSTGFGHLNGEALAPGVLHAWGESAEFAGVTRAPFQFGIVSFSRGTLDRPARALGVELDLPRRGEFRTVRIADGDRLRDAFDMVVRAVRDTPAACPTEAEGIAVADLLIEVAVRSFAVGTDGVDVSRRRLDSVHITRLCEEFAVRRNYQGLTLADLCKTSGASERRVRGAFYECYGISPMAYLRIAALHEVHHSLLTDLPMRNGVSRAASDFGFWHLSRFAGQYREVFGESPSETLDRATADLDQLSPIARG
jgi:AraC-like DNA-binding protein